MYQTAGSPIPEWVTAPRTLENSDAAIKYCNLKSMTACAIAAAGFTQNVSLKSVPVDKEQSGAAPIPAALYAHGVFLHTAREGAA